MSGQQWEHLYLRVWQDQLDVMDGVFEHAGDAGFEVVTSWAGGHASATLILKRPGRRRPAPEGTKGDNKGWYPDPYGTHDQRYWSGHYWSQYCSTNGEQVVDVPG